MVNMSKQQKIVIIILTLFIIILFSIILYRSTLISEIAEEQNILLETTEQKKTTLSGILEKYNITFIKRTGSRIYVKFDRKLYDDDGFSNKEYFDDVINELVDFLQATFYLVDESKNIDIKVFYVADSNPIVRINNQEDFYGTTDGKTFTNIENVKIIKEKNISVVEETVDAMQLYALDYSKFLNRYGQPEEQDEYGYYLFDEGNIRVALYNNNQKIRNVVYSEKYLNNFVTKIKEGYSLNKVEEVYGKAELGGQVQGYLGYRNNNFYIFFYEDEISVYPYGYIENYKFEDYLEELDATGDLNRFQKVVRVHWDNYYEYEYVMEKVIEKDHNGNDVEKEIGSLRLTYPTRGVEIVIKGTDVSKITFYNNYCFTDEIKEYIKNGKYQLNYEEDFIDKIEKERKENEI